MLPLNCCPSRRGQLAERAAPLTMWISAGRGFITTVDDRDGAPASVIELMAVRRCGPLTMHQRHSPRRHECA